MSERATTVALIVAAGEGLRAGGGRPKQYIEIGGRAVLTHAVDTLAAHPAIDHVQVVIGEGQHALYREATGDRPLPPVVIGGATRAESVRRGLAAIEADHVLIHDAARPFCPAAVVDRLIDALNEAPGAVPVLPIADTLAGGGAVLGAVVPRDEVVRVQTPQAFHLAAIRRAHAAAGGSFSDDAQVARAAGLEVRTVMGDPMLEKLTYPSDFAAAEARRGQALVSRTATGFDVHGFTQGDHVMLGGVAVPHGQALAGHSDADVALHALTDALLGTLGDGDIGSHFPPSDPEWRGAASDRFLLHAADLIARRGGRIDHVDVTIIAEAPKVGPHREAIRANVARLLKLPAGHVSIKATTTERLGFTGRGEGIAAQAAATVRLPEDA